MTTPGKPTKPTKRDFLTVADLSLAEARTVLRDATALKAAPKGSHVDRLRGRAVREHADQQFRAFVVGVDVACLGQHEQLPACIEGI